MSNSAYQPEDTRDEMLGGKITAMSPRPVVNHNIVAFNIAKIFSAYLKGKPCMPFGDGVDLFLSPTDRLVPDGMIVCNKELIKADGVHGTPDLVIEVLSTGTAKRDKGYKKDLYERSGVKEYWLVDIGNRSIDVYLLKDGKFALDNVYSIYPDYVLGMMTEEEIAAIPMEFCCSLFAELRISVAEIFEGIIQT